MNKIKLIFIVLVCGALAIAGIAWGVNTLQADTYDKDIKGNETQFGKSQNCNKVVCLIKDDEKEVYF